MAFQRKSKAISILLTITMLLMLWPGAVYAAPTITNAKMDNLLGPNYIRALVNFSEGIYGDADKSSAVSKDDFDLTVNSNGGAVTNAVINAINNSSNGVPAPGNKNFLFFIGLTGGPPSGTETIAISPAVADAVYGTDEFMAIGEAAVFTLLDKRVEFAAGYPQAGSDQVPGSKQVQLAVKPLNETVTAYYVVVANGAAQPSAAQIMAEKDSTGQPAIAAGSQADITSDHNFTATLPADATDYDAWLVIKDAANNVTDPVRIDVRTPDASSLAVIGIAMKTQPTKLAYTAGETLDLSGLVATLTYHGGSSEDVAFDNFAAKGITTAPAHGVTLATATHHDQPVVVKYDTYAVYTNNLTVTEAPGGSVCQIGSTDYATLDRALTEVTTGQTIKLLQTITHTSPVVIDGKKITFNISSGQHLTIDSSTVVDSTALTVQNSGSVNYTGGGNLNIVGDSCGVHAKAASGVSVTNVTATGESAVGVLAVGGTGGGSTIIVDSDVHCTSAASHGAVAYDGSKITIGGQVECLGGNNTGVFSAYTNSLVQVGGGVTVADTDSTGVNANNGGEVQITGDILAGKKGITVYGMPQSGKVTVYGNVTASGPEAEGISAGGGGTVTVSGNVTVYDVDSLGVYSNGSTVNIGGNVDGDNGARAVNSGIVTIEGTLTTTTIYIKVGDSVKGIGDYAQTTTKEGYLTYTDNIGNNVWVKGRHVTGIAVKTQPSKLSYSAGETLDLSGLVVILSYNDSSTLDVDYSDFSYMNITANPADGTTLVAATHHNQPIAVSCNGQTVNTNNLTVLAAAQQVTGIAIKTQPSDLTYTAGETLDLSGLVVTLTHNDSSTLDVDYSDFSYMNITANPANGTVLVAATHHNQPIAVSCNGQTTNTNNLTVTAAAQQVTGIVVKTQPSKLSYSAGETLDLSGLVVTLTYNDSSTREVDYSDFSYMNITANPANGTVLSAVTHHNQPIAVSCNGQTTNTNNLTVTSSSSTGGGGGGGASSAQRSSVISDVVETAGDKTLDQAIKDNNKAVLSLADSSSATAQLSSDVINKLAEHKIPFSVENTGVRLDFAPGSFDSDQVTAGGTQVEIGAREVTGTEKDEILAEVPAGQSTGLFEIGGKIFDFTALVKTAAGTEQRIENFGKPVDVTIDLSHLGDLTPEQISQLTGVRLEKDEQGNLVPVNLGGKYDPATKTFTFSTDKFSLYTVMRSKQATLRQVIELTINSLTASVNGSSYTLDAAPQIVNDRTLVPIRFVSEALGAQVTWDSTARQVTVKDTGRTMILTLDSSQVLVNGKSQAIDCAPAILPPGRVFVPLRFVGETLGVQVEYDDSKQITVTQ
ncbi:copper amine oxidase N-terminal domain-containing protein [Desulforamulus aeronauticus]|uniref:Copper amine oxidase N-terminal domain-containing protein n=1 Tax=Desulforamulus aeronauticus DSM 10349 TaxID=1121421 RepID=A0A1M6NXU3_9FIRM|nr:copper amine oxidase N-terminal domain-containing protein [Desulforamulus aeronauticus]SHK00454.1 Copper amine oxidase N-terminal domain-containing protein [Desulforamulus aeronauticus DSM 10349]